MSVPRSPAPRSGPDAAVIFVGGMHRSGTSAMARALALCGGRLPQKLVPPAPDNPEGYWEPADMVALNDEILAAAGSRWDDVFLHQVEGRLGRRRAGFIRRAADLIRGLDREGRGAVLKDPRAAALPALWNAAAEAVGLEPRHVLLVRHPAEVAASLAAREAVPPAKAELLWAASMLAVEQGTRGRRRLVVDHDAFLAAPVPTLEAVAAQLGGGLKVDAGTAAGVTAFLKPSLRHHRAEAASFHWPHTAAVLDAFRDAARDGREPDAAALRPAREALDALAALMGPQLQELRAQVHDRPELLRRLAETADENGKLRDIANAFHGRMEAAERRAARDSATGLPELAAARAETLRARALAEELSEALHARSAAFEAERAALKAGLADREAAVGEAGARADRFAADLAGQLQQAVAERDAHAARVAELEQALDDALQQTTAARDEIAALAAALAAASTPPKRPGR
ncbi:MAG: hypothetical protein ACK5QD_12915, partial [Brevundimonas sp.]|uniref:hypothetical protein n=1 Tax=Brevundimonas sp. TaxID=1871086 RepID=UPI003918AA1A